MGYEVDLCYAFIIPERMQKQGIQLIEVRTKRHTFLAIAPPGYLYQNWDVLEFIPITSMLQMKLEYQINNFIKIGNEDCVPDPLFNRDDCFFKQLIRVSTTTRCLKITEKVSFNIASEVSYIYIFEVN